MRLIRLYIRVLGQLGSDLRVGAILALANIALAISAFAEPILFGRIIDVLTRAQTPNAAPVTFGTLTPLILAWVAFGLFSIGASALVALHADRLAHRRRLAVVASYFEHVLELPLAFPVILTGIRIVLVQNIGLATIAALIGGGGFGVFVFQGIGQTAMDLVLLGAVPTVALAFAAAVVLDAATEFFNKKPGRAA